MRYLLVKECGMEEGFAEPSQLKQEGLKRRRDMLASGNVATTSRPSVSSASFLADSEAVNAHSRRCQVFLPLRNTRGDRFCTAKFELRQRNRVGKERKKSAVRITLVSTM